MLNTVYANFHWLYEACSRVLSMCVIAILEPAHEDLRKIVAYLSNENPNAAETLVRELLDEAMRLESVARRPIGRLRAYESEADTRIGYAVQAFRARNRS